MITFFFYFEDSDLIRTSLLFIEVLRQNTCIQLTYIYQNTIDVKNNFVNIYI